MYITQTSRANTALGRQKRDGANGTGATVGWVKTNTRGEYKFYTVRPASYSQTAPPAHIHITVKEPKKGEYWIDDFLFDDDPFLTPDERTRQQTRGGDGILKLKKSGARFYGQRNIYLGKNVTGYPL
jgi:protocatechuate 3,4-dioxygenase beta subunit